MGSWDVFLGYEKKEKKEIRKEENAWFLGEACLLKEYDLDKADKP